MRQELQDKLINDFPDFFRGNKRSQKWDESQRSCLMMFGIETGDGWYDLIYKVCARIKEYIDSLPEPKPNFRFEQIKEKFATLRLYGSGGDHIIWDLLDAAEQESVKFCEDCGSIENVYQHSPRNWIMTKCEKCWEKWEQPEQREKENGSQHS